MTSLVSLLLYIPGRKRANYCGMKTEWWGGMQARVFGWPLIYQLFSGMEISAYLELLCQSSSLEATSYAHPVTWGHVVLDSMWPRTYIGTGSISVMVLDEMNACLYTNSFHTHTHTTHTTHTNTHTYTHIHIHTHTYTHTHTHTHIHTHTYTHTYTQHTHTYTYTHTHTHIHTTHTHTYTYTYTQHTHTHTHTHTHIHCSSLPNRVMYMCTLFVLLSDGERRLYC